MKLKVLSFIVGVVVGAATLLPVQAHAMGGGFHGGMRGGGFRGGMMGHRFWIPHASNFNGGMMRGRIVTITAFHRHPQVAFFHHPRFGFFHRPRFAFFPHRRHFIALGGPLFYPGYYGAGYAAGYGGDYAGGYGTDYCVWQKVWFTYRGWRWRQVCNDYGY